MKHYEDWSAIERESDVDEVEPVELRRQLNEMDRVLDVGIQTENGFLKAVIVELAPGVPDMLAEVMYDHSLRYADSFLQPDRDTHRVRFETEDEVWGKSVTAKETQAEYHEHVGQVYQ